MNRYISPNEAALILRINPKRVRDYLRSGQLPGKRNGKYWLINELDINEFQAGIFSKTEQEDHISENIEAVALPKSFSRSDLEEYGFKGFVRISDLKDGTNTASPPPQVGVYLVIRDTDAPPEFKVDSRGYPLKELNSRWVASACILNIGKAGGIKYTTNLSERIRAYIGFGSGKNCAHRGGRSIWQLGDSDNLLLAWMVTNGIEPRRVERELIAEFRRVYGKRPFANLQD